jgi:integrase-like protein
VIRTPVQAPNADAFAERWVRTIRSDCLDRMLILGHRHLEHVLRVYRRHYNEHRPTARFAYYRPTAVTQRRGPRLQLFAVAICSADSPTNTTPPEFANPTREVSAI